MVFTVSPKKWQAVCPLFFVKPQLQKFHFLHYHANKNWFGDKGTLKNHWALVLDHTSPWRHNTRAMRDMDGQTWRTHYNMTTNYKGAVNFEATSTDDNTSKLNNPNRTWVVYNIPWVGPNNENNKSNKSSGQITRGERVTTRNNTRTNVANTTSTANKEYKGLHWNLWISARIEMQKRRAK